MNNMQEMRVKKRDGRLEDVSFDKILRRVKKVGAEANVNINFSMLVMKIIDQLYDGIETTEIDNLTAQQCASEVTKHPDFGTLAGRLTISNHQKNTSDSFFDVMKKLYECKDIHGKSAPLLSEKFWKVMNKHHESFQKMIDYERDYFIDYFGFKTLERAYLMKINKSIIERPQHMWLRVSIGIHGEDVEKVRKTYDLMSTKYFTHATPTLFNSGTPRPQLSSCYLLAMEDDSIDGIYSTLRDCAKISKWAGGIGLHIHNIRASGTYIRGTNGTSNGIVPMLRVFNNTARYVDQGGGRRNGSFAIYLEPWHADIEEFLEMKKNHGDEEQRARDLFYAVWIPDLFMERVKAGADWTYMCPDECPGLSDVYGDEFKQLYEKYESEGRGRKTLPARETWFKILDSQMETGTPYMLYKDACNQKSNQKNLGTIKSSNLCTEIIEYSNDRETAVCNLASIALSNFVVRPSVTFKTAKVYSKTGCNYCKLAKRLLDDFNIPTEMVVLDDDEERKQMYLDVSKESGTEVNSVPQIYLDNGYIGGWSQLRDKLRMKFDYEKLHEVTKVVTENLNKVIDINFYPTEKTERSNFLHRPIGIGVQGLADAYMLMDVPYHSEEATEINKKIFETIYHAALERSNEIAKEREEVMKQICDEYHKGKIIVSPPYECHKPILDHMPNDNINVNDLIFKYRPTEKEIMKKKCYGSYSTFEGSPASEGILQFDMWNVTPSDRYDWNKLKADIVAHGLRNSLLVAPMPTASTSQILGNNECFEPYTSNIYTRRTLAGEFMLINKHLIKELITLEKWGESTKNSIIEHKGSVQQLTNIPKHIRDKYKIVWEIPMKHMINMSRDRGAYICQSQSLNLWVENPSYKILNSMHFYSWQQGLKTGIYYLRRKAAHQAQQFTIEPDKKNNVNSSTQEAEEEICDMCSS